MALGVPVVSTAVMGTREILDGGEGCLIAAAEADFAAKTVRLLSDSNLRARLGEQARTWSAPILADRMLAFYWTLVSKWTLRWWLNFILPHGTICTFHSLSLRERAGEREKFKSSDCAVWQYKW